MRNLDQYQIIFCDIDDTLIYGFWTDLMKWSWNVFRCNWLSNILMVLQEKFKLYKINQKLKFMIINSSTPVVFLTARKFTPATEFMLCDILETSKTMKGFECLHLATDKPAEDKYNTIIKFIHNYLDMDVELNNMCLFDDNKDVRMLVNTLDVDTFDPIALRENVR